MFCFSRFHSFFVCRINVDIATCENTCCRSFARARFFHHFRSNNIPTQIGNAMTLCCLEHMNLYHFFFCFDIFDIRSNSFLVFFFVFILLNGNNGERTCLNCYTNRCHCLEIVEVWTKKKSIDWNCWEYFYILSQRHLNTWDSKTKSSFFAFGQMPI